MKTAVNDSCTKLKTLKDIDVILDNRRLSDRQIVNQAFISARKEAIK